MLLVAHCLHHSCNVEQMLVETGAKGQEVHGCATLALLLSAFALLHLGSCEEHSPRSQHGNLHYYVEQNTLIGKEIDCTEEEKDCFRFNRVLQPDGKCYKLQHRGHCENHNLLQFNKTKAEVGKYEAECKPSFQCNPQAIILAAYDGKCYTLDSFIQVCRRSNHSAILYSNFFGETSCRCYGNDCPPVPGEVTQPEQPGRCRIPDLARDNFPYLGNPLLFRSFLCTPEEHECLAQRKMRFAPSGVCHTLLERGPCADGERFVANKTAFQLHGLLQPECSAPSCPGGQVRMQFDGKCYRREDAINKLCPPEDLVFDVFGDGGCGGDRQREVGQYLPQFLLRNKQCTDWSTMHREQFLQSLTK